MLPICCALSPYALLYAHMLCSIPPALSQIISGVRWYLIILQFSNSNNNMSKETEQLANLLSQRNRYIAHLQEELERLLEMNNQLQQSVNGFVEALSTLQRHLSTPNDFEIQVVNNVPVAVQRIQEDPPSSSSSAYSTTTVDDSQESTIVWDQSENNPENYPEHPKYKGMWKK